MDTTVLQWNLDSYNQKSDELKILVREYKPQIICLQETQLSPENNVRFQNYEILRKDYSEGLRACSGIAIFIKDTIHYESLNILSPIQVMAVKVYHPITYTICNIYIPPLKVIVKDDLIDIINQLESPYLIVGDFNAHNIIWGSNTNNSKGKIIEQILAQNNNIVLINQLGVYTHFNISTRTESIINLALSSSCLSTRLTWKRHEYLYSSDHYPITITFHTRNQNIQTTKKKWLFHTADWSQFTQETNLDVITDMDIYDVDLQTRKVVNEILDSASSTIPQSSGKIPPLRVPWWNKDCQLVLKNKKKSFLKFKRVPTVENWITSTSNRALARRTIKKEKKDS